MILLNKLLGKRVLFSSGQNMLPPSIDSLDTLSNAELLLSSYCSERYLSPHSIVSLTGFSIGRAYFKGLLDKAGLAVECTSSFSSPILQRFSKANSKDSPTRSQPPPQRRSSPHFLPPSFNRPPRHTLQQWPPISRSTLSLSTTRTTKAYSPQHQQLALALCPPLSTTTKWKRRWVTFPRSLRVSLFEIDLVYGSEEYRRVSDRAADVPRGRDTIAVVSLQGPITLVAGQTPFGRAMGVESLRRALKAAVDAKRVKGIVFKVSSSQLSR